VYNREDQTRNISNNTIKLDDIYNLYNSSDKIGAYENTQLYAVYNNIILSTPCKNENLSNLHDNDCDYEQNNKASVLNGFLYKKDSLHEDGISTWIMDKNGQIYIGAKSHAYYLKGAKGDESYGYPRPIACGGDIVVQDHKIIRINNRSGHYKPTTDQFILALKKMIEDKNGFLHKDVKIDVESELGRTLTYEELMNTPAKSIINNYNFQN
jgi:starch synthase